MNRKNYIKKISIICLFLFIPYSVSSDLFSLPYGFSLNKLINSGINDSRMDSEDVFFLTVLDNKIKKSKKCEKGFDGTLKTLVAIPYAIAYLILLLASLIYLIFSILLFFILTLIYGFASLFLWLSGKSAKDAKNLWDIAIYLYRNSTLLFKYLDSLNTWYNGNCVKQTY